MKDRYFVKALALLIILCSTYDAVGQNCNLMLKGNVSDQHEDHSLEFATVYIQETQQGTVTNETGDFSFTDLCPSNYHLIISHIGCDSKTIFVDIRKDTTIQIIMEHHDEWLDEVLIKGQNNQNKTGQIKSVLSKDMMTEMTGKTISEMLSSVPGISLLRSGPNLSKPIINGLYGHRVLMLNNGIPQEGQQWGNDHAPEIDPASGDKISVYKGANAIKYGLSALGGLVMIEPNEMNYDPHWHGEASITGVSNGKVLGVRTTILKSIKAGNTRITGGYTKGGDRHTREYYLSNTGNTEASFSFLISNKNNGKHNRKFYYSYYHSQIGILRGSHVGNLSDLKEAFTRDIPFYTKENFSYQIDAPRQKVHHHLAKYTHQFIYNDKSSVHYEGAFQANIRKEFDIRRGERSNIPSLDLSLLSVYNDLQYSYQPSNPKQHHAMGLQYKFNNNSNLPGTGISPLMPDYLQHMTALYYIHKNHWKSTSLEGGFRAEFRDYHVFRSLTKGGDVQLSFLNIAANIGAKREITSTFTTSMDISYTARPPEINELFSNGLHQGVSGIEEGDKSLHPEQSLKIANEWNGHIGHSHHIHLSLFYNHFWNFIYLQPTEELRLTIRGAFPVFRYVGADVDMAGFSIRSNYEITPTLQWTNTLQYTYAQNISLGQGLIRIPPLSATSQIQYSLGPSSLYNEAKIGVDLNHTARQNRVNPSEDFLAPPSGYWLTNASIKLKWKTSKKNDLDFIIRAENIMDVKYRDYLNRLRYFADEIGRNIYVTLNLSF